MLRAERHRSHDANAKFQFDVCLEDVGIKSGHCDVRNEFPMVKRLIDTRASGKARLKGHDPPFRDGFQRELVLVRERMPFRNVDASSCLTK